MVKKEVFFNSVCSMEKKLLTSASLAALLLAAACGAFKPDHPQVYQSFKDRRAPKENVLAESGALGKKEAKNDASFRPYSARPSMESASDSSRTMRRDSDMLAARTPVANNNRMIASYDQQPAPKSDSSANTGDSVMDRLLRWLNASAESTVEVASLEKRQPSENIQSIAYSTVFDGQGSTNSYSYYEIAEDIQDSTGEFGQIQNPGSNIELAQNTVASPSPPPVAEPTPPLLPPVPQQAPEQPAVKPGTSVPVHSQPLIAVPKEPSLDEMKTNSAMQPQPDLKNIPPAPKEFTKQPDAAAPQEASKVKATNTKGKKPGKRKKGKSEKHRQYYADNYGEPNESGIRDRTSSLQYIGGRPVVTGYLIGCDRNNR